MSKTMLAIVPSIILWLLLYRQADAVTSMQMTPDAGLKPIPINVQDVFISSAVIGGGLLLLCLLILRWFIKGM